MIVNSVIKKINNKYYSNTFRKNLELFDVSLRYGLQ